MYFCRSFGLYIHSELLLPAPAESAAIPADVMIRYGHIQQDPVEANSTRMEFRDQEACFTWEDVGSFLVRNGNEIIVHPRKGVDEQMLVLPLTGPVFSILLHQRGLLVLHASAVAHDGRAMAFIGHKGAGKSTTAATLQRNGFAFITDDLLAIAPSPDGHPLAYPGFQHLKLWPDAIMRLGEDPVGLARLHPGLEKRRKEVSGTTLPLPLAAIYVLRRGTALSSETLSPGHAFLELTTHSYCLRYLDGSTGVHPLFPLYSRIVQHTPVRHLYRSFNPSELAAIADLIKEEIAVATPASPSLLLCE